MKDIDDRRLQVMETGCRIHRAREGTTVLTKLAREGLFAAEVALRFGWRTSPVPSPHKLLPVPLLSIKHK